MSTLLQIRSSLFSDQGQSSQLADQFIARWQAAHPDGTVVTRDLAARPIPHLTAERFSAFTTAADQRTAEQHAVVAESDALIAELRAADVVVLGLPLYNFGMPSTLKAYIDHIARAGETFRYTEAGPVGLLGGRQVRVFAARGGLYAGTPLDTQTTYLRNFLAFLGMTDVEFIYAEGLAMGDEKRNAGLSQAHTTLSALAV